MPRTARWARNGIVWLTVSLAGQAALAATFRPLVALVGGGEVDAFFAHPPSFWLSCAVPTVVSILGWIAGVQLLPSLERRWALFVPAWLAWVILISAVSSWLAGEGASAGTGAWGLLLALLALLPRVSLQRLGLGSILAPSGE